MKQLKVYVDIILLCLLIDISFLVRTNTALFTLCFHVYSSKCVCHLYRKPSGSFII